MTKSEVEAAVTRAFEAHYLYLVRFAYRLTGAIERAEDAVQASFLAYYRALARSEEILNEKAWLLCVTRREARRIFERDSRECGLPPAGASLDDIEAPPSTADPAFAMDSVLPLLALLSPREEEALHLRLSSMKYKDIAAELGVTIPTVNTLLARAVDKLRRALKPAGPGLGRTAARKEGHAARRVQ